MMDSDENPSGRVDVGRRGYDQVTPTEFLEQKLQLAFSRELGETRHALREDITVLATAVQSANLAAEREHGAVRTELASIAAALSEVPPLKEAVVELQRQENAQEASAKASQQVRRAIWQAATGLAALLIAGGGVLTAILK